MAEVGSRASLCWSSPETSRASELGWSNTPLGRPAPTLGRPAPTLGRPAPTLGRAARWAVGRRAIRALRRRAIRAFGPIGGAVEAPTSRPARAGTVVERAVVARTVVARTVVARTVVARTEGPILETTIAPPSSPVVVVAVAGPTAVSHLPPRPGAASAVHRACLRRPRPCRPAPRAAGRTSPSRAPRGQPAADRAVPQRQWEARRDRQ